MKIVVKPKKTVQPTPAKRPLSGALEYVGGESVSALEVYISASTHYQLLEHGREDLRNELGGVLVGHYRVDDVTPFIDICGYVRADKAVSHAASLEFTHDAWQEIHQGIDAQFPGKQIIGWFHTHPGYGIFLSGYDRFIDTNWFTEPYHVAAVLDPTLITPDDLGVFVWQDLAMRQRARSGYVIYEPKPGADSANNTNESESPRSDVGDDDPAT